MGDFNAGEKNPAILHLKSVKSPPTLVDTFRVVHPKMQQVGTTNGWNGRTGGHKIDYIFTTPDAKVKSAAILHDNVDGRYPSDHYPVVAEIEF